MLKYLVDENVDPTYTKQLRRLNPDLFTIAVGDITAPPKGTLDPEILLWCEENRCILVTNNRKSMPVHLADHIALGHHVPGILILNPNYTFDNLQSKRGHRDPPPLP